MCHVLVVGSRSPIFYFAFTILHFALFLSVEPNRAILQVAEVLNDSLSSAPVRLPVFALISADFSSLFLYSAVNGCQLSLCLLWFHWSFVILAEQQLSCYNTPPLSFLTSSETSRD